MPSSSTSGCALIFAVAHPVRAPWTAPPSSLLRPSLASAAHPEAGDPDRFGERAASSALVLAGVANRSFLLTPWHGSHGGASAAHARRTEGPQGSPASRPAARQGGATTLGRARLAGPARARWQDGDGVGLAAARAVREGGRASAGGGSSYRRVAHGGVERSRCQAVALGRGARMASWAEPERPASGQPDQARRATEMGPRARVAVVRCGRESRPA